MRVYCAKCGKLVADIAGHVRRGTVCICRHCWNKLIDKNNDIPDFLKGLYAKGNKR
jgi:hypothetical protein